MDEVDKKIAKVAALGIVVLVVALFGFIAVYKEFNRYQKRAEASNRVEVTKIEIRNAQQQAKVNRAQIEATKAEAEKRYQESIGIRRAQDEVQATLTPLYVQHEAIQAQRSLANSPSHTTIWAPAGNNGVPIVTDPLRR